ncbi:type VII secretion protein EccE [Streptomyces sp. JJ38]|uniref:type VII secretion protein EccE n=1 Tax=Streptomyces sp. JJ38 TaxID=2738128 RepID=UPI001C562CDD|nr:type VII secretion protein EccE [Streptomyces sp. JJ38]
MGRTATRTRSTEHGSRTGGRGAHSSSSRRVRPAQRSPRGPVTLGRESTPGSFGPVHLLQVVLVQVAACLVLTAWVVSELLLVPAAVVAVVLVALGARWGRRSLPERIGDALAFRRRAKSGGPVLDREIPAGLVPLVESAPGLRSRSYTHRDGRSIGVIGDETFSTVLVRVERRPRALNRRRDERPLPLALLRDALEVDGIRLESVQVVQHTQPAPAPALPPRSVAALSYGPLQAESGAPAVRVTWVALKLDPELCAEAVAARGGGFEGAQRALVRVADHLASRLVGAGFRATVLSEDECVTAMATSVVADPMVTAQASHPGTAPARRTAESVRSWRCDDRWHTVYGIRRWPALGTGGPSLVDVAGALSAVPALATTLSITLAPRGKESVALTSHVRITGRGAEELSALCRQLEEAARRLRVGLVRLDREQAPGVLASIPLGGL